jgi:hypothetical protein
LINLNCVEKVNDDVKMYDDDVLCGSNAIEGERAQEGDISAKVCKSGSSLFVCLLLGWGGVNKVSQEGALQRHPVPPRILEVPDQG